MKKIYILFAIAAITLGSCKKGLDPQLYGSLSTTTYPKTEADFATYVAEVYKPFQSKWGYNDPAGYENDWFSPEYGDIMMFDYPTDVCNIFTGYGGFFTQFSTAQFTFLQNQGTGSNHFEKIRFVTRITQIIDDINKSSISAASKATYTAEARMARGWCMYFLLQLYGPVPVILDPAKIGTDAETDLTRPTRAAFLASIVSDLTYAAANLPKAPADYGRFNQAIALTVLMRTYMNEKDFVNAEKTGRQIMTMGYSLVNDYASLYKEATERNNETMWAISCVPDQDGSENHASFNPWDFYTYPKDYPGNKVQSSFAGGDAPFSATWSFYNSFDANDKRRSLLIASYTNKSGIVKTQANGLAGPVIAKYPDLGGSTINAYQGNDIPKARLGDVMLLLAEAINQNSGPTAEAIGLVNQVRLAHGGTTLGNMPASATADKASFDNWILKEEGWETYFEGERKMDLVRHGQWQSALATVGKTAGPYLFPVPTYEITASKGKLTQTPGY
ncbi:RagB/SusD family nutrient uptake outer membrane protein [Mucilaginibacter arboris]|uniref:RagB/SusD family nutrient uptake outer membrane protein n=1 Tax=Mucilaginibacter arboris TaxID=2682090 RepID=A0A7K1SVR9_9SPHI|nr:RagB/SusD family nutrient uptake outer membrane protein [Mucilaginibacter arboris]MVN21439.1 RagB/SusD family nutrient uptake outer membrane protein [Mucilaginibacter arboris]